MLKCSSPPHILEIKTQNYVAILFWRKITSYGKHGICDISGGEIRDEMSRKSWFTVKKMSVTNNISNGKSKTE